MARLVFFCWMGLFLLGFATSGWAERQARAVAKQKSTKSKVAKRVLGGKKRSKRVTARNKLYPFTLRVLYTPSYRFLTKQIRDNIDENKKEGRVVEFTQFFPIAAGLEGEFAFNKWLSLAVGGSFSRQGDFYTIRSTREGEGTDGGWGYDYHEFVVGSSLYVNVNDYFKLGTGIGLTFANMTMDVSGNDDGKKIELTTKFSWKKMSANLSLRRDFFLTRGMGFGIGLTASMYFTDMLDRKLEMEKCKDGVCKTTIKGEEDMDTTTSETCVNGECTTETKSKDDDNDGVYSILLIPMIYVAF